jgi:hypothetical protein
MEGRSRTMTAEELRISRNRAYVEYLHATDITDKAEKLAIWKAKCLEYNDVMKRETN